MPIFTGVVVAVIAVCWCLSWVAVYRAWKATKDILSDEPADEE